MPSYAHLEHNLRCPHCREVVTDMVWFQWGYSSGYAPRAGYVYHLHDPIHWKVCKDGSIMPWTYFERGGGNLGDPSIRDLIARDTSPLFQTGTVCESCNQRLEGAAVEIRGGVIQKAWVYLVGEFNEAANMDVDIYY